jgi:uncharacterized repeat protein (TIGR03847 family)
VAGRSFDFDEVKRVTAGAIGAPGKRSFYLQLRSGMQVLSLALEKQQLQLLAERLQQLLPAPSAVPEGLSPSAAEMALEEPLNEAWRVGSMTLAYDEEDRNFEVSLVELAPEGEQPATGQFRATADQMRALAEHTEVVVSQGRPACVMCGGPNDHDGGICPRMNGHRG